MNGEASLWIEEFRGEMTASMVYDGRPVHDHFKRVDDDTVMGIMNGKGALDTSSGTPRHLYFYLRPGLAAYRCQDEDARTGRRRRPGRSRGRLRLTTACQRTTEGTVALTTQPGPPLTSEPTTGSRDAEHPRLAGHPDPEHPAPDAQRQRPRSPGTGELPRR